MASVETTPKPSEPVIPQWKLDLEAAKAESSVLRMENERLHGRVSVLVNELSQCVKDFYFWKQAHGNEYATQAQTRVLKVLEDK